MKHSETIANLSKALAESQAEFKPVPKSKTGQEGNRKFKYADLADVVNMITPILSKHGVFFSQPIILSEGSTRQTTRLQLGDEYIQTDGIKLADDVPGKNLGISVTYARRIDLNGLLGIAPDEDVDAPDLKADAPRSEQNLPAAARQDRKPAAKQVFTPEITDDDFPPEFFVAEGKGNEQPLGPEDAEIADNLGKFVPLSEDRNNEIQNYLKELVSSKTIDRRKLSLFLDREHGGKKSVDVSADKWERTIAKVKAAVEQGADGIKALLKGE